MTKGLQIEKFPYNELLFVGALLYKEYPSTLVYSDENKLPYIVEWVDVDEDGLDKFFIYQISHNTLKQYINNKISHFDLVNKAISGLTIFYDGQLEEPKNILVMNVEYIDADYLPSITSFFNKNDSEDLNKIFTHFELYKYVIQEFEDDSYAEERPIEYHSLKRKSELFRVHLQDTNKVIGHGKANTKVLGNVLINIDAIYNEMAMDKVKGKNRSKEVKQKKNMLALKDISNTEVVITEAASFSVYIRPIVSEIEIKTISNLVETEQKISGEEIFKDVLKVIHDTSTPELIEKIKDNYSTAVFVKVKEFVEHIKKNQLAIDLDYYSPISTNKITEHIDIEFARNISNTISVTNITDIETPKIKGRFKALDCSSCHFRFESEDKEEFTGYLDSMIQESVRSINFIDRYEITVKREKTKNIVDLDYKYKNIILAALKID